MNDFDQKERQRILEEKKRKLEEIRSAKKAKFEADKQDQLLRHGRDTSKAFCCFVVCCCYVHCMHHSLACMGLGIAL